jgi:hypothetical protein
MSLRDLQTNLKSLRYGNDLQGGGDSGLPYITTDVDTQLTNIASIDLRGPVKDLLKSAGIDIPSIANITTNNILNKDSGFIRGGTVGAAKTGLIDVIRIGKFLVNNPLWIAKQVGLQLSNPKLESPRGTLALVTLGNTLSATTGGIIQPSRIYNLGINTLAQVPSNAVGVHFYRHGLGPVMDDQSKYEAIVRNNNESTLFGFGKSNNRLLRLKDKLNIDEGAKPLIRGGIASGILNILSQVPALSGIKKILSNNKPIDEYLTGPGSFYGIGSTLIRRFEVTTNPEVVEEFKSIAKATSLVNTRVSVDRGIPRIGGFYGVTNYLRFQDTLEDKDNTALSNNGTNVFDDSTNNAISAISIITNSNIPSLKPYANIANKIKTKIEQSIPFSDSTVYTAQTPANSPFSKARKTFKTIDFENTNILDRDPYKKTRYYGDRKVSEDGSQAKYNNTEVFDRYDSDILTVAFRGVDLFSQNEERWLFSAYMTGFRDSFDATWNDINYIGRSETFYVYSKFKRSVSFNLRIPCFNRTQLFEKHRALGQLASTTAGRYSGETNALGGVLLRLNVGSYLVGEYATLNSLNYTVPDDTTWDITPEARLAMYIEASFSFNIVHQKLPQYLPSKDNPTAGFFGYLQDSVPGDARFLQIPNRKKDEQQGINNTFVTDIVSPTTSENKGTPFNDIQKVIKYEYPKIPKNK